MGTAIETKNENKGCEKYEKLYKILNLFSDLLNHNSFNDWLLWSNYRQGYWGWMVH